MFLISIAHSECPPSPIFTKPGVDSLNDTSQITSTLLDGAYINSASQCAQKILVGGWDASGGAAISIYEQARNFILHPVEAVKDRLNNPLVILGLAINPLTSVMVAPRIAAKTVEAVQKNTVFLTKNISELNQELTNYFVFFQNEANRIYENFESIDPQIKAEMACEGLGYVVTAGGLSYFFSGSSNAFAEKIFEKLKTLPKYQKTLASLKTKKVIQPSQTNTQNALVFKAKNETEVTEFMKDPRYDGSKPIPQNVRITATVKSVDETAVVSFDTASIAAQSKKMRKLLKEVKEQSLASKAGREREFGSLIVDYDDGTSRVVNFTSGNLGSISGMDMDKAYDNSKIFLQPDKISRITHVHTHPSLANTVVTPSLTDYKYMQALKNQAQQSEKKTVEVEALVLPNCKYCDDLFFRYRPEDLMPIPAK